MTDWPFAPLLPGRYSMIMCDPPWNFRNYSQKGEKKGAHAQYPCLSLAAIRALPVAALAAPDALLWLWATNPMLPQALEVMAAWGFTFTTAGTWLKMTRHGKIAFGTGYVLRSANEPFLIGRRGRPVTSRSVRGAVVGPVRQHSRKPDAAYAAAEALMPYARYRADLFSRENRQNWHGWGAEAGHFDPSTPGAVLHGHDHQLRGLQGHA